MNIANYQQVNCQDKNPSQSYNLEFPLDPSMADI